MRKHLYYYSSALCGAGKTQWAVVMMATTASRYIYAIDRVEEFDTRRQRILDAAPSGAKIEIINLSRQHGNHVSRDFPSFIETYSDRSYPHVVILVTHECLKRVDHALVKGNGWTLIVDEDLKPWSSGTIELPVSASLLSRIYDLEPIAESYSKLKLTADGPGLHDIMADDLARPLAALHDRVQRLGVAVNLTSWAELDERQRMTWFSVFDLRELRHYDAVYFLANSFERLLTYKLSRTLYPEIDWAPIEISRPEAWKARELTIKYAVADHVASTNWLDSTEGHAALRCWADWVKSSVTRELHYFTGNLAFLGVLRLPGRLIMPKVAGMNDLDHLTECSILYAAKASKAEAGVFAALTGGAITPADVQRDREYEDLVQIVFRSSLRVPSDDRPVTVRLYDKEQAQFLADFFASSGLPFRVKVEHEDIGIVRVRRQPGRPVTGKAKSQAERAAAYRARKRADRMIA
ncbi:MAG: hypothetical protein DWQ53_09740 [Microcystis flos-aquae DF17]|nr:MAG: hypothetical protein DWQ53_09740 [Microcystis flos-aquae DF17]